MSTRPNSYRPRCYRLDDWSSVPLRAGGALGPFWTAVLNTTGKHVEQGTVMDPSDPKTWTDGLSVVLGAPHIVAPLVGAVALGVWWFRGMVDKSKIDGLQERLDNAKEQQSYLSQRLTDAQAEIGKLRQQIDMGADTELLRATAKSAQKFINETATANTQLGNTISDPGRITIIKVPRG
jgi:hypothetical protein